MGGETTPFEGWAILELMGHRKLGGYLSEATLAGAGFLRIQVPRVGAEKGWSAEQLYAPSAVYAITPTTEAIARGVAARCQPEPVTRWELPPAVDTPPDPALASRCEDCGKVYCICPEEEDDEDRIDVVDEGADCPRCGNPVCCCAATPEQAATAAPPEAELVAALRPPTPEQADLYESAPSPISLEDAERLRSGLPLRPALEDPESRVLETIQAASTVRPTVEEMESALTKAAETGESNAFLEGGWFVLRCVDCTVPICVAPDERMEVRCPTCNAIPPPTAPTAESLPGSSDDEGPTMPTIRFTVFGQAKTAGSKRAFPIFRGSGPSKTFVRSIVTDDNPKSRDWKNAVSSAAREV